MTPAPRVPETMPLASLLVELRGYGEQESFGLQMAIVWTSTGALPEVVTLEDAVEETWAKYPTNTTAVAPAST